MQNQTHIHATANSSFYSILITCFPIKELHYQSMPIISTYHDDEDFEAVILQQPDMTRISTEVEEAVFRITQFCFVLSISSQLKV